MNSLVVIQGDGTWRPAQYEAGLRAWLDGKFFTVDGEQIAPAAIVEREKARDRYKRRADNPAAPKPVAATPAAKVEDARIASAKAVVEKLAEAERIFKRSHIAGRPRMQAILTIVASAHRVSVAELFSPSRRRVASNARQHFAWIIRTRFPATTFPMIGEFLKRDHSTIVHAVDVFPIKAKSKAIADKVAQVDTILQPATDDLEVEA